MAGGFTVKPSAAHPWQKINRNKQRAYADAAGKQPTAAHVSPQQTGIFREFDSPSFLATDPDTRGLTSNMIYRVGLARFTSLERARNVADMVSGVVTIDGGGPIVYAGPKPPEIPRCGRPC